MMSQNRVPSMKYSILSLHKAGNDFEAEFYRRFDGYEPNFANSSFRSFC